MVTVRKFNTEGPVVAADHYHIPPLERIDLDAVLGLIRDKKYFVLHAPRQTGKTDRSGRGARLATSCCTRRGRPARPPLCWRCGIC